MSPVCAVPTHITPARNFLLKYLWRTSQIILFPYLELNYNKKAPHPLTRCLGTRYEAEVDRKTKGYWLLDKMQRWGPWDFTVVVQAVNCRYLLCLKRPRACQGNDWKWKHTAGPFSFKGGPLCSLSTNTSAWHNGLWDFRDQSLLSPDSGSYNINRAGFRKIWQHIPLCWLVYLFPFHNKGQTNASVFQTK